MLRIKSLINMNDRTVQSMGLVFWVQCKELGEFKTKPIETTGILTTTIFKKPSEGWNYKLVPNLVNFCMYFHQRFFYPGEWFLLS